jgi:hypothetical protein
MLPDSKAKVKHFFEKATMDFNTLENNGEGFFDITKDVEKVDKNLDGFKDYLISRRVLDYERKGLKHGFDVEYSKKFIKQNSEKYKQFSERFDAFNDKMLNYLKDSGVYNDDQIAKIKESSKDFIPFKRIFSDENASKAGKGKASVKRRTGSERDIQDPFLSLVENAEAYIETAEKNRAQKSFVDAALKVEDQDLITKEKSVNAPINVTKEVSKILEDYGVDAADEAFTIFRPSNKRLSKNQIEIFRDGKREVYTINDDLLAESFKSLDFAAQSAIPIIATMAAFTKVKKIGISFTPEFISRNFFRDQVSAGVFSEAEGIALKDVVVSMGDFLKKNDEYYRWLKAGGANGAFMEFGDRYLKDNIYKSKEMMSARERVTNIVKKPVEFIELLGNLTEQATRMAEFKRVTKGATSGKQLLKGGMASREITLDYQKVGLKIQAANQIVAYLNPSIQGLDKTAQAFRNDPKRVALRAGALLTVPSLILAYVNKDDERVKELPQWQKDFFWIIANDDWQDATAQDQWQGLPDYLVRQEVGKIQINRGSIYRIPKPAELGLIFGSIPERIFNSFAQGKDSTYGLSDSIISTLLPNVMPDAFGPVLEQMTNKSFFSGSHLIPFYLEKVAPEDQYKEYTSETAIALGKIIGHVPFIGDIGPISSKLSSPIIVENYIRSWTGTLGSYALQISDEALKAAGQGKTKVYPSKSLSDMPVIRAFTVRYPTMSTDSIIKFNDKFNEMEKIQNSFKLKMKRFQTDQAMYLLQNNEVAMANLSGFKKSISTINQTINNIYYNDSISSDNKKQLIESSYYQMVEIAKSGLEVTRQLEDNVKKLEQEK